MFTVFRKFNPTDFPQLSMLIAATIDVFILLALYEYFTA